jgi:hypothetical protein
MHQPHDAHRARAAAQHQLVELLLAHVGQLLFDLDKEGYWSHQHPTFESMLRDEFGDEADWYLAALGAAKVRRHLRRMGAPKLDALLHNCAAELSRLPPEHQLKVWLTAVAAQRMDYGTIKMAVERLLNAHAQKPTPQPPTAPENDEL